MIQDIDPKELKYTYYDGKTLMKPAYNVDVNWLEREEATCLKNTRRSYELCRSVGLKICNTNEVRIPV